MFAQIENGIITAVFEGNFREVDEPFLIRDITDLDPQPGQGWRYDGEAYFPPVDPGPVAPVYKTEYTHREFIIRLGLLYAPIERLKDTNAALPPETKNYELSRLFTLWEKSKDIDLLDEDLQAAFTAFVGLGMFTREEADAVMVPNEVLP
jgi:hypothetical protein